MWAAALAGLLGGLLGPLIGVGGGVIVVPLLNLWGVPFQAAAAASMFSIVVSSATAVYNYRRAIDFKSLAGYAALSLAAAAVSAAFSVKYSGPWVKLAYGLYLVSVGSVLLKNVEPRRNAPWLGPPLVFIGGFASSLFGVGGGTVFVPTLMLTSGLDAKRAAAMSMGIIFPTAVSSVATYAALGVLDVSLAAATVAGSFVGSYISSRYIMGKLRRDAVRRLFVGYVYAVGVYYLWSYLALFLT
ncbi:sulfite exporter TauE/SafE family protein [Pyrobaculum neutrophilum]|uniref:Probable membrane transporter protein n=1 Tax=Pyrobaculum neutrophilum (strain DSM 2338 / JCM 9278 / NBRC 100436 / V24Sta) TaxID=444157 RepID=B1Y8T1_PYRNV|nr:sulfite exporter TauE/SafE family protein [Pyrobaculum neutrophilum]ACB40160.1 protein of unknown function DUF81 [Pyrobaculum neutrophilum V24Sta]